MCACCVTIAAVLARLSWQQKKPSEMMNFLWSFAPHEDQTLMFRPLVTTAAAGEVVGSIPTERRD